MMNNQSNNKVTIKGKISSGFTFDHELYGEKFYKFYVDVRRFSETIDTIPCLVSERLMDITKDMSGEYVNIKGEFRSYNKYYGNGDKFKLILLVFVKDINFDDDIDDNKYCKYNNRADLIGYIVKEPTFRKTPMGREISDVLLAVNRDNKKSDYIHCICWGRDAKFVSSLAVGSKVKTIGRIQSRDYIKKLSEDECITKTAYEVSINVIELLD